MITKLRSNNGYHRGGSYTMKTMQELDDLQERVIHFEKKYLVQRPASETFSLNEHSYNSLTVLLHDLGYRVVRDGALPEKGKFYRHGRMYARANANDLSVQVLMEEKESPHFKSYRLEDLTQLEALRAAYTWRHSKSFKFEDLAVGGLLGGAVGFLISAIAMAATGS